jgi:hypothetical protein
MDTLYYMARTRDEVLSDDALSAYDIDTLLESTTDAPHPRVHSYETRTGDCPTGTFGPIRVEISYGRGATGRKILTRWLRGQALGPRSLRDAATRARSLQEAADQAREDLAVEIRDALEQGYSGPTIAATTGLTAARVYQIRDGKR